MKNILRLTHFIKGYWKDTIVTWVLVIVETALEVLIAFQMTSLLNEVKAGNINGIVINSIIIAIMALVACAAGIFAGFFASSAASGFGKNIREAEFIKIQDFSFKNIDDFSTSSIVTRTTTDVTNIQNAFMMICRTIVRAPFMMIFALIMAFVVEPRVAWIFLVIIPVLLFVLVYIAATTHPIFVKVFNTYDELNENVQENVDGIRAVKSFNREEQQIGKFNKISDFIYKNFIKAEKRLAFNSPVMNLCIYTAEVVISYIGAQLILGKDSNLDVTSMSTLFTYVMMILSSLMMISMVYVMITIARNSTERVLAVVDEKLDLVNPENPIYEVKEGSVDFNNISFAYNENKYVLKNIDLHFKSGQTVGIIGPTGSGKTTIISLIARLYDVSLGEILVGGVNVKDYDLKTLRDNVAVVLQKNTLFTGTIKDNLLWGNENATEEEIWKACDIACASEFIKSFPDGLNTHIEQGGNNVSGGQKQRLCIARALLKSPKILILDDSTSACDTHTDHLIREGLNKERGDVTTFIIAQRVQSIKDCDTILVMDNGEIQAIGNNEELMNNCQVYKELYESQLGGGDFDVK